MRFCAKLRLSLLVLLALAACDLRSNSLFTVDSVDVQATSADLDLHLKQRLRLSDRTTRGINSGVPVILELYLELRDSNNLSLLAADRYRYEIRYLPMSERYQLSELDSGRVRTYPRLRHALRALGDLRLQFDTPTLANGSYELRARMRLDKTSLPAPIQLPALIFGAWKHDTEWTEWPFRISA
jgi:hypothetical protein